MAFLCVSQQGEFKNTIKHFFGEIHVKNFWPKKVRGKKNFFPFVFSHRFFFIAFLAVSLQEEPKNTIKIFFKIRPENRKKSQKRYHGTYVAFFFFLRRPLAFAMRNGNGSAY